MTYGRYTDFPLIAAPIRLRPEEVGCFEPEDQIPLVHASPRSWFANQGVVCFRLRLWPSLIGDLHLASRRCGSVGGCHSRQRGLPVSDPLPGSWRGKQ